MLSLPCHLNFYAMNDQEITQQFLSQFPRQIDGLVYLFLRSIAHERMVHSSGYALSRQLGIYRTTLFRILYRLEQQRMIRLVKDNIPYSDSYLIITLLLEPCQKMEMNDQNVTLLTDNVTLLTDNVTLLTDNVTLPTDNVTLPTDNVTLQTEDVTANSGPDDSTNDADDGNMMQQKKSKKENPPAPPKEKSKRKNSHQHTRVSQQTLEMRRKAFIDSLAPFASRYDNEMLNAFADYWTEPNRSLTCMRFEMQKTWSTALRLATWSRNETSFDRRRSFEPRPTSTDYVRQAQQWAIEESMRVVREAQDKRMLRQNFLDSL